MRHTPTIRQLEAFLAIEASRNVTLAAQRLNVSQPALSRTLRLTEEAINASLFHRDTRNVTLTAAGKELLPIARRMVGEFNYAFSKLGQFLDGHSGRVVVASLPSAGVALLPRVIEHYGRTHPNVEFELLGAPEQQVLAAVRSGAADIGLMTQPPPAEWFTFRHLLQDDFVLLCRRDDPLAAKRSVDWSVLAARPFISMQNGSSVRPLTDSVFIQLGLSVHARCVCDNIGQAGALVAAGLGLTAVPRLALHLIDCRELASITLKRPSVPRHIGLVIRSDIAMSPAASRFVQMLEEENAPKSARRITMRKQS